MTQAADEDLYRSAVELLRPGDIELEGVVVHTDLTTDRESMVHQLTLDVGDVIAEHVGVDDWYVYAGNDDPEFGINQYQGLTLDGDDFVWECQQLVREGTFDVVFYWEVTGDHDAVVADLREEGNDVVAVTEDGFEAAAPK